MWVYAFVRSSAASIASRVLRERAEEENTLGRVILFYYYFKLLLVNQEPLVNSVEPGKERTQAIKRKDYRYRYSL